MGHFMGFLHAAFLFFQGSTFYTKAHVNKYFRMILEVWMLIHGTTVAMAANWYKPKTERHEFWPILFCGFLLLFCFTMVWNLPIVRQMRNSCGVMIFPTVAALYISVLMTISCTTED